MLHSRCDLLNFYCRLGSEDKDGSESAKPADQSETESEGSQKSQTGKDFEIVEHDEVDE
jgi:hypothetical protein